MLCLSLRLIYRMEVLKLSLFSLRMIELISKFKYLTAVSKIFYHFSALNHIKITKYCDNPMWSVFHQFGFFFYSILIFKITKLLRMFQILEYVRTVTIWLFNNLYKFIYESK